MIVTLVKQTKVPERRQGYWGTLVFVPSVAVAEVDQLAFEDECFAAVPGMVPADAELMWGWMDAEHFLVDVFSPTPACRN